MISTMKYRIERRLDYCNAVSRRRLNKATTKLNVTTTQSLTCVSAVHDLTTMGKLGHTGGDSTGILGSWPSHFLAV